MLTRYAHFGAAVLSGVAASLLIATTAFAAVQNRPVVVYGEPQENLRTERFTYADLDLNQPKHERKLNSRVAGAVKRVCLYENRIGLQDRGYYACADDAWGDARPQIARAVARAREIAATGQSSIAATAVTINIRSR